MNSRTSQLRSSSLPLADAYDVTLLDLDGVIYLLDEAIPGAEHAVQTLRQSGNQPVFVTNNASRLAGEVAQVLTDLGIKASSVEVQTSAQTAVHLIAERFRDHDHPRVLVTGSAALAEEVVQAGLAPTQNPQAAHAVVQGYAPSLGWCDLADAAVAVRNGALWVATNTDATLPSPNGPLPGNGSLVNAVAMAVGHDPQVIAGKPEPVIYRQVMERFPGDKSIAVGDRWDTDIAGANAANIDSMLVFTGVADPRSALTIPPEGRPTYLGRSVTDALEPHPAVVWEAEWVVSCRGWTASLGESHQRILEGEGASIDAWRALCELSWSALDAAVCDGSDPIDSGSAEARAILAQQ